MTWRPHLFMRMRLATPLVHRLKKEGIPIGHQTRGGAEAWDQARIYPVREDSPLPLTRTQEDLFRDKERQDYATQ